jgi:hypothetical protein
VSVLFIRNIFTDEVKLKTLRFHDSDLSPQSTFIDIISDDVYFELFPVNYFHRRPNGIGYTVGKINMEDYDWRPVVKIPQEYDDSNIRLGLGNNYNIAEYNGKPYYLALLTNYVFNMDQDTIRFSNLPDPIKYSLDKFKADTVKLPLDRYKLDSISHANIDFFFLNDFLYVIANLPWSVNGKIALSKTCLNKYTLNGEFISSVHLNEDINIKSIFYAENRSIILALTMIDQKWHVYEIPID